MEEQKTKSKWRIIKVNQDTSNKIDILVKATQRFSRANVVRVLVEDAYNKLR